MNTIDLKLLALNNEEQKELIKKIVQSIKSNQLTIDELVKIKNKFPKLGYVIDKIIKKASK